MIPKTSRASEMTLASLGLLYLDHALIKARFQTIRQINFENNRLSDVSALGELPKLTKLRLRNNRVNAAFGRANAFERLTFLDLSGNCISSLSALSLGRCAQLRTLLLADNFLTRLDGINQLKSLRVLDADKNKLSRIDANTFDGCESFRVISLRKNAFRTVKHLKRLEHVRELRLDDNRIDDLQEISWLAYLPRLRALSLMGNVAAKVEKYDEFVTTCCRGLTSLDGKSVETLF
jgi:Leucine-rich repeat (LRR) protein